MKLRFFAHAKQNQLSTTWVLFFLAQQFLNKLLVVEAYAATCFPFSISELEGGGETFSFNMEDIVSATIERFGLEPTCKEQYVSIAQSLDGAQISKNINHVTYGIKMNYWEAVCPTTSR